MEPKEAMMKVVRTSRYIAGAGACADIVLGRGSTVGQALEITRDRPHEGLRWALALAAGPTALNAFAELVVASNGDVTDEQWDALTVKHNIPTLADLGIAAEGEHP